MHHLFLYYYTTNLDMLCCAFRLKVKRCGKEGGGGSVSFFVSLTCNLGSLLIHSGILWEHNEFMTTFLISVQQTGLSHLALKYLKVTRNGSLSDLWGSIISPIEISWYQDHL